MGDLKKTAARLAAAVRNMPPGQQRQDALKDVGRLRSRIYALLRPVTDPFSPLPNKPPLRASRKLTGKKRSR
jgi:hypothetical protein